MIEDELIGLGKAEAVAKIEAAGLSVRITQEDDQVFPIDMAFDPNRVNLAIKNGKVFYADRE